MSYIELLKDPRWQRKRLEIFQRDDWTCQANGEKGNTLNVHHKIYIPGLKPWEYENDLLITLCLECHEIETLNRSEIDARLILLFRKKFCCVDTLLILSAIENAPKGIGAKELARIIGHVAISETTQNKIMQNWG